MTKESKTTIWVLSGTGKVAIQVPCTLDLFTGTKTFTAEQEAEAKRIAAEVAKGVKQ